MFRYQFNDAVLFVQYLGLPEAGNIHALCWAFLNVNTANTAFLNVRECYPHPMCNIPKNLFK